MAGQRPPPTPIGKPLQVASMSDVQRALKDLQTAIRDLQQRVVTDQQYLVTLSGSISAAIAANTGSAVSGSGITSVAHDTSLSGLGTGGSPLSAVPTFSSLSAAITSSLGSLYTSVTVGATASLGNAYSVLQTGLTASVGNSYSVLQTGLTASVNNSYSVLQTAVTASNSSVTNLSGTVAATDIFLSGNIVSSRASTSGTINSAIVSLSSTLNSAIGAIPSTAALSGTVDAKFKSYDVLVHQVTGTLDVLGSITVTGTLTSNTIITPGFLTVGVSVRATGTLADPKWGAVNGWARATNAGRTLVSVNAYDNQAFGFYWNGATQHTLADVQNNIDLIQWNSNSATTRVMGQLQMAARSEVTGGLDVSGSITVTGSLFVSGTLSTKVFNPATITTTTLTVVTFADIQQLQVDGTSEFASTVSFDASAHVTGVLDVTGSAKVTGTLSVLGSLFVNGVAPASTTAVNNSYAVNQTAITASYTVFQAGITSSVNNAYTVLQAGETGSNGIYYASLQAGVTASVNAAYTVLQAGETGSNGIYYTTLQTGVSASIVSASGTINSAIVSLSSTINSAFGAGGSAAAVSGVLDASRVWDGVDWNRGWKYEDDFFSSGSTGLLGIATSGKSWIQAGGNCTNKLIHNEYGHPGILNVSVLASGTSFGQVFMGDVGAAGAGVVLGGGPLEYRLVVRVPVVDDNVNNAWRTFGVFQSTTLPVNGIYFDLSRTRYGDNEFRFCTAATSSLVQQKTGVTVSNLLWYKLLIDVAPNGDAVTGSIYCTGSLIGQVATKTFIPNAFPPSTAIYPFARTLKSLGAAAVTTDIDYMAIQQTFTGSRF